MKIVLSLALAAILAATSGLYLTGPETKTVVNRYWEPRTCYGDYVESPNCEGGHYAKAGYRNQDVTVPTSAWERISGAITGSGNVD